MFRIKSLATTVALAASLAALQVVTPCMADEATRSTMGTILGNYQQLLRISADAEALRAPANREALLEASRGLGDAASALGEHARRDDAMLLAGYLDRFGLWIEVALLDEEFGAAQALIYEASELCVACHTRLPESSDSPRAEAFVSSELIAELPHYQRGRLEVATRRFSAALTSFEKAMDATELDPDNPFAHYEVLVPYLSVALAATDNSDRARQYLEQRAKQGDLSAEIRDDLQTWAAAIDSSDEVVAGMDSLGAARTLVAMAQPAAGASTDRWPGLAHYMLAAPRLQEYLESRAGTDPGPDLAEAYYLLGVVTYETATVEWLPHAELYLENAILAAPHTSLSVRAYDLLEAKVVESLDLEMTAEIAAHLEYMRELAMPVKQAE